MNRILTLTTGGLFAAMAVLPVAAFAQTGAAAKDAKPATTMGTQPTDGKAVAPSTGASADAKGHKVETKTEAKGDAVKHDGMVKTPESHSSTQPKPAEQPNKS